MKPAAVILVIGKGNVLQDPAVLRCEPGSRVAFVVFNEDTVDHTVWIEPGDIVLKSDKTTKANPLAVGKKSLKLSAGEVDMLKQRIKPAADFGASAGMLPYTTYKYTFVSADAGGAHPKAFDPDIDVCPP